MYKLQLKELRKKAGFKTQESIADYLGVKLRKYQTWERGEVALTLEDAYTICVALKCTPNDLCGWPKGLNEQQGINDVFESELITCYRSCTPLRKDRILDTARDAAGMSKEASERDSSKPKRVAASA